MARMRALRDVVRGDRCMNAEDIATWGECHRGTARRLMEATAATWPSELVLDRRSPWTLMRRHSLDDLSPAEVHRVRHGIAMALEGTPDADSGGAPYEQARLASMPLHELAGRMAARLALVQGALAMRLGSSVRPAERQ